MDKINYQNGKVYKIWSPMSEEFYVGSSTQPLHKRLHQHRNACNNKSLWNMKLYQLMREIGKDNFFIELVEEYPCNEKSELCKREGQIIRELKPTLNFRIAGRTTDEYYEDTKEHQQQRSREYWLKHREVLSEKKRNKYIDQKEEIKQRCRQYYMDNRAIVLAACKQYYINNKEKRQEQDKIYKDNNKEQIAKYREENKDKFRERFVCDICGGRYTHSHKSEHFRSKKHVVAVNNRND